MNPRALWWRENTRRYKSRQSCQRACDYVNRAGGELWREPVISEDGSCFEMWCAVYADLWPSHNETYG